MKTTHIVNIAQGLAARAMRATGKVEGTRQRVQHVGGYVSGQPE